MRQLQFGCGTHQLPEPWENYDKEVDIRLPLPFENGVAGFIFAEHVIEHVPFRDGLNFLGHCYRVLCPGGVLRLSFPDMTAVDLNSRLKYYYTEYLKTETGKSIRTIEEVYLSIATDWDHQSIWTYDTTTRLLKGLKFREVYNIEYGWSDFPELHGIDGRHLSEGPESAKFVTTVIEAIK